MQYLTAYEAYSFLEMRKIADTEATNRLKEAKELLEDVSVNTRFQAFEGNPAAQIVNYAERKGIDVIVMGRRGLGRIKEFFLGSVSHNVVQMG